MANNYGLFFTRDGQVVRLPVNPEKLSETKENDNGEFNVLGIGPIMQARIPKLRVVTISSFFPGRPFSGVLNSGAFQPPEFFIDFFRRAMDDRATILYTPVRYYENGEPFFTGDTGFPCLVTSFQTEERGGETGDFYYDLEITEYRDYSPQGVQVQQAATAAAPAVATKEPSRDIPTGEITVGATCIANGSYYYTSYGDEPHGNGNGRTVKVSRIVDASRPDCVHITDEAGNPLGWISKDKLQVVTG